MGRVERGDSGIDIETGVEHEYVGLLDAAKIDAVGDDSRAARSLSDSRLLI
ncbi:MULTISPECIES: hypothetical protein [Burkholderia cepacia complex]|uniref:hypothetical protein n=1 Tax=Burkholderia cepacia complex TaxID=87882 RepID=UPI001588D420|nr:MULTISPECIES: hypothetical protein [Burkholderia cepacia complex]ELK6205288.1 hypothetical protein [Burkholderia ambifaria]